MLAPDASVVVFRNLHIVAAAIWVGSLFVVAVYVQPIAADIGLRVRPSWRSSGAGGS